MWIRIRELSFPTDRADEVINYVRDTAVARFDGESHRGFRLLVDRPNGRALEVSYWETEAGARADTSAGTLHPTNVPNGAVERTNHYELAIDAA
jgi:hypothetical protein